MKSHVSGDALARYELTSALLLYNSSGYDGGALVTEHPVSTGENGAKTLGAGRLLTLRELDSVISQVKGGDDQAGFVPPEVVFSQRGCIAWWVPASQRSLHYRTTVKEDANKTAPFNGKPVWCPPLVFIARARELKIFALARNERPNATTPLCVAPFWNIWEGGRLCLGSVTVPEETTFATLPAYEKAFFRSFFTHPNVARLTNHKRGFFGLWTELAATGARFAPQRLLRLKLTLHDAVRP